MGAKKHSYSRFYAICRAKGIDTEQFKDVLVSEFTKGRTDSLKEMTEAEYDEMCDCLQNDRHLSGSGEAILARRRKARSAVLTRIQKLGIDTTDFAKVNEFCLNKRIAGKPFGMLSPDELDALIPKLEAMLRKPKPRRESATAGTPLYIYIRPNQMPS